MPVMPGIELAHEDHAVQLYGDEGELAATVAAHLAAGLAAGDPALAIATAAHRSLFSAALSERGIDVASAIAEGRLVLADAGQTLAQFMRDGRPDAGRFRSAVGSLLPATPRGGTVRAYGEMVALLWEAGQVVAALELEALWNGLRRDVCFSLLCAYPAEVATDPAARGAVARMCAAHRHAFGVAPVDGRAERTERFSSAPTSTRSARSFVAEVLDGWGLRPRIEAAALVTTELATNAVRHGGADFTVGLSLADGSVVVAVGDADFDGRGPDVLGPDASAAGGRGMAIVDALAIAWGIDRFPGGKTVWASLGGESDGDGRS